MKYRSTCILIATGCVTSVLLHAAEQPKETLTRAFIRSELKILGVEELKKCVNQNLQKWEKAVNGPDGLCPARVALTIRHTFSEAATDELARRVFNVVKTYEQKMKGFSYGSLEVADEDIGFGLGSQITYSWKQNEHGTRVLDCTVWIEKEDRIDEILAEEKE